MYLIAGLGNPGLRYKNTRHNIGYLAAEQIAYRHNITFSKHMARGLYGTGTICGQKVIILKPETYMNLSGECIREFLRYFDIPVSNLLVIHDDIEFASGTIKIRQKGSGGTHNGMKNIILNIKSEGFPRIRIGVGNNRLFDLKDYVLSDFLPEEFDIMKKALETACDAAELIVSGDTQLAMNRFNTPKEKKPKVKPEGENNGEKQNE